MSYAIRLMQGTFFLVDRRWIQIRSMVGPNRPKGLTIESAGPLNRHQIGWPDGGAVDSVNRVTSSSLNSFGSKKGHSQASGSLAHARTQSGQANNIKIFYSPCQSNVVVAPHTRTQPGQVNNIKIFYSPYHFNVDTLRKHLHISLKPEDSTQ